MSQYQRERTGATLFRLPTAALRAHYSHVSPTSSHFYAVRQRFRKTRDVRVLVVGLSGDHDRLARCQFGVRGAAGGAYQIDGRNEPCQREQVGGIARGAAERPPGFQAEFSLGSLVGKADLGLA